ncbi:GATA transcription factor 24-like [Wolffia australiana]
MSENTPKGGLYPERHIHAPVNAPSSMHLPVQIDEVHSGDGSGGFVIGDQQMLVRQDGQGQNYGAVQDHGVHQKYGGESMEDQNGIERDGMEGDMPSDAGNMALLPDPGMGNQLTLSFQGEVYVFDSVSPEKVQAVLLLLGGRELNTNVAAIQSSSNQNNKRSNFPQRVASLMRFREKRKERNFDKKIRYTVRKEVALRMQRNKGQFTSSKSKPDDSAMGVTSWDSTQCWAAEDSRPQAAASCHHCGISSKSTPMMRRGPNGPRTLCNACGLMWANKGTLRDLSKSSTSSPMQGMPTPLSISKEGAQTGEPLEPQPLQISANGHDGSSP